MNIAAAQKLERSVMVEGHCTIVIYDRHLRHPMDEKASDKFARVMKVPPTPVALGHNGGTRCPTAIMSSVSSLFFLQQTTRFTKGFNDGPGISKSARHTRPHGSARVRS
jgi:hypothetical protein